MTISPPQADTADDRGETSRLPLEQGEPGSNDTLHSKALPDDEKKQPESFVVGSSASESNNLPNEVLLIERIFCCCCVCCGIKNPLDGNKEALAWALDTAGRAVSFVAAGAFLSTALIELARVEAGCEADDTECDKRLYGMIRPSSLLTTYTIVVGVVSACLLPLLGAICDYTPHRLVSGQWLSVAFCVFLFPQIFVSQKMLLPTALLQMGVAFAGWAQTMIAYAFLPELTSSEATLNRYTQTFTMVSFSSMLIFLATMVGIATYFEWDTIQTARAAMAVGFGVSAVFLYIAWFRLFEKRPAARTLPADQSLWTSGFKQVLDTSRRIYHTLPALKWFYISVALIDAAINSLATIAITYMSDTLQFDATENGIAFLCMIVGSIPGGYLGGRLASRFTPIVSNMACTFILMSNTIVAAILLVGAGQEIEMFVMACIWGIGTGGKWTTDRILASTVIPTGQDTELMGTYLFYGQVLTWLPPLLFTLLNEAGVSQRVGIGSLAIWFLGGFLCLSRMGSYRDAVVVAGRGHILEDDHDALLSESQEEEKDPTTTMQM